MKYKVQNTEVFNVELKENIVQDKITEIHIVADTINAPQKLNIVLSWQTPVVGIHATWSPGNYKNKEVGPVWVPFERSCAMSLSPVYVDLSYDDMNRQTIACADCKNTVEMHTGVIEENGCLDCVVKISVDYAVSHYETIIRIDQRNVPFDIAIDDVRKWWETFEGYTPAVVPEAAYDPVYSTWYSFHQKIDVSEILEECKYFSELGCKTLIVDDGWETDNTERGYSYCGDWYPTLTKVPDMKAFVQAVHDTGMKFVLWYSVPFVGAYSKAYAKFKDKILCRREGDDGEAYVVDPRYPEIREYLIGTYKQAVLEWGIDGFKLDFVDSFIQSDVVKEGMDYTSVYDAVERLLKDVICTLQAIKPDILIEFRQSYIGPLMRTFGNMLRSFDCPADSFANGMNTLALRLTSGHTAVHSDMVMWNYKESAEMAAFQLYRTMFSVPQISVRANLLDKQQAEMVKRYLRLWNEYKDVLLFGKMMYKGYVNNYLYVSARNEKVQAGAIYSGRIAYIDVPTEEIVIFNVSLDNNIIIDVKNAGEYLCHIYDCCGNELRKQKVNMNELAIIHSVPVNGTIVLNKC